MEREVWTDQRLDDLADAMRSGFGRLDADIRDLRVELREGLAGVRDEIGALRTELGGEVGSLREELGALKSTTLRASFAGLIALLGILAAVLARGI